MDQTYVSPRYFETVGAGLRGREFDRNDTAASPKVAVVNEAFVSEFLRGEAHPEARWLSFDDSKPEGGERTSIVGVVRDIRQDGIQQKIAPRVYVPLTQKALDLPPDILVRTALSPAAVRAVVLRELPKLGAGIAVTQWGTVRQRIDDSIFETRLLATLGGFFGVLALLLAAVGLYSVVSYSVAQRTNEFGIRMALGAQREHVLKIVLQSISFSVGGGICLGAVLALVLKRVLSQWAEGSVQDPLTLAGATVLLGVVAAIASAIPALRASRVDPMVALRYE